MKAKYIVSQENGYDENGQPILKVVKVFKNEPEATTFYNDDKNIRRYGALFMSMRSPDGTVKNWNDKTGEWI